MSTFLNKPSKSIPFFVLLMIFMLSGSPKYAYAELPFIVPPASQLSRLQSAMIETDKGNIFIELYPEEAPIHVANFKYRADKGLFHNSRFHKFTPGYALQGGNLNGKKAPSTYQLPAEFSSAPQERGTIGMARSEDLLNPERSSDAAQFYILLSDAPHMTGKYTNFGKVIKGFSVIEQLRQGDLIRDIKVYVR